MKIEFSHYMFKIFKKKPEIKIEFEKDDIEKAKILGFISEEEFLKIKIERAEKELKSYYEKIKEEKNFKRHKLIRGAIKDKS